MVAPIVGTPAPPPPPVAPGTTPITPGSTLRGQQFMPTDSARVGKLTDLTDAAAGGVAGFKLPGFEGIAAAPGSARVTRLEDLASGGLEGDLPAFRGVAAGEGYNPDAATSRARELSSGALEKLAGGPSRSDLAMETYKQLQDVEDVKAQEATREAFQRNAGGGRLGSGFLDTEIGDIFGSRKVALANAAKSLATESAGKELDDRRNTLAAILGAEGQYETTGQSREALAASNRGEQRIERGAEQEAGLNKAELALRRSATAAGLAGDIAGRERAVREEGRGERAAGQQAALDEFGVKQSQTGTLADLLDRAQGTELRGREEMRGERDYQNQLARQDVEDRFRTLGLESDQYNADADRELALTELLNRVGGDQGSLSEADRAAIEALLGGSAGTTDALTKLLQGLGTTAGAKGA